MDTDISKKNITTICNKENIILKLDKNSGIYSLEFNFENGKINIHKLLSSDLYNLIEKLNNDLIDKIEILKIYSEDEVDVLFIFKRIGAELGLPQKYMAIKTIKSTIDNNICFKSTNIEYPKSKLIEKGIKIIEPLICEFGEMIIYNTHLSNVDFFYRFKITSNDNLPVYMENYIGLMMKKIFYKLKEFIDKFDYNYYNNVSN